MSKSEDYRSYCRQCGGERSHDVVGSKTLDWADDEAPVYGSDTWSILECRGCQTVSFSHTHWFSEDGVYNDDGFEPTLYRELFPPAPERKMPEWGLDLLLQLTPSEHWIDWLHKDIYAAAGMKSFALAAMGARAIVDHVVTEKAGEGPKGQHGFKDKLHRMHDAGLISMTQVEVIYAAFDAGSAAAHRGHRPDQTDIFTLFDITESLLEAIYISPARHLKQVKAAENLKAKTPVWKHVRDQTI